jgi:hypothetical protein
MIGFPFHVGSIGVKGQIFKSKAGGRRRDRKGVSPSFIPN